jgi:hypothetical protein
MFELPDEKMFKDIIHDYIRIPRCFVENIIDTELFQRLRNIEQTGMRVLCPDAKHDRFGHSLGVYHLGYMAVNAMLDNLLHSKSKYWFIRSDDSLNSFWVKNKVLFLIACLLHDIGHAPFSHSLENEMLTNSSCDVDKTLKDKLDITDDIELKAASHEKMGALLVFEMFSDKIEKIFEYLKNEKFPARYESALVSEPITDKSFVDFYKEEDLRFIARMILGLKYDEFSPEQQIKNCFIELLNGSNFDVDKLDYILRDTQVSGMKNISNDTERLLKSIDIVTLTKYNTGSDIDEAIENGTVIQSLIANSDSELEISGYVDGSVILSQNSCVTLFNNSYIRELINYNDTDNKIAGKIECTATSNLKIISNDSKIMANGASKTYSIGCLKKPFKCELKKVSVENEFKFTVSEGAMLLTLKGYCSFKIEGSSESSTTLYLCDDEKTTLKGKKLEMTLVENTLTNELSDKKYNMFSIGFKKVL